MSSVTLLSRIDLIMHLRERFRMLQFNLPKPDRIQLHKDIAQGRITPAQLNVMSSTDLADERTKHEIKVAEKESLEHSILQRVTAPRAKITHKGFEEIEDQSGAKRAADTARDEEEQRMAMERRERERLARLRAAVQKEGSPTTPVDPSLSTPAIEKGPNDQAWGAPPAVPSHALQDAPSQNTDATNRPQSRPLFVPSASDFSTGDEGLDLADLIHIDEDVPPQDVPPSSNPQERMSEQLSAGVVASTASPVVTSPSGPSPFAPAKPAESPRRTSFDLNALWTQPGETGSSNEAEGTNTEAPGDPESFQDCPTEERREEAFGEVMDIEVDEDQDLDAMLEKAEQQAEKHEMPIDLSILSKVWEGQVS